MSQPAASAIPDRSQRGGVPLVLAAVVCFSTAPVFVLTAQSEFTPFEIAFWRVLIATGIVGALALVTRTRLALGRGEWRRYALYGLALAVHLSAYVAALRFTTIAHAVALTYTSPAMIALLSSVLFRERPAIGGVIGLGVAIAGVFVLAGFTPNYGHCDIARGSCMQLGDGIALVAALAASIYTLAGRAESERHPLYRYAFAVYGWAAIWLAPVALIFALVTRHGYAPPAVGAVVALGVVPLGMGHTLYNAALRRAHPTLVNLVATQEITGGIILGVIFYHQIPQPATLAGIAVLLAGIVVVMLNPPRARGAVALAAPES